MTNKTLCEGQAIIVSRQCSIGIKVHYGKASKTLHQRREVTGFG